MFAHIERWRSSCLTQKEYCRKARINHSGFYYWLKWVKEQFHCEPPQACFILVSVQVPEETMADRIIVTGPNGMEILFPCTLQSIVLIRQLVIQVKKNWRSGKSMLYLHSMHCTHGCCIHTKQHCDRLHRSAAR
jgi:hypothetical protein